MKILIATSYSPYPVSRGTHRLVMNLIKGLSVRHQIVLVTMTLKPADEAALRQIETTRISVKSIIAPNRRSLAHRVFYKMRNLFFSGARAIPLQVLYAAPIEFLNLIRDTAREERVDLVVALYWHLYDLPKHLTGIMNAVATQDLDFMTHRERLKYIPGTVRRIFSGIDARMQERIEKEAYRRYESILTVTDRDTEILKDMLGESEKAICALPLAIDLERYRPDSFEREPDRIIFLGAFDADFNRDALLYFIDEVFPIVLEKRSATHLEVVGHGADRGIRARAGSHVRFVGRVDDVRPHLGQCSLMVLPLRFGGGVRIRMMEAAAMGTPVVSTPVGVAGMGLVSGREYVEASSTREMAQAVVDVLENPTLARHIGEHARGWAEKHIGMDTYPDRLDDLIGTLSRRRSKSCLQS